jgi:hypothetical protein
MLGVPWGGRRSSAAEFRDEMGNAFGTPKQCGPSTRAICQECLVLSEVCEQLDNRV